MRPGFIVSLNLDKRADFNLFTPSKSLIRLAHITDLCTVILMGKLYCKNKIKREELSDVELILNLFETGQIEALTQLEGEFI